MPLWRKFSTGFPAFSSSTLRISLIFFSQNVHQEMQCGSYIPRESCDKRFLISSIFMPISTMGEAMTFQKNYIAAVEYFFVLRKSQVSCVFLGWRWLLHWQGAFSSYLLIDCNLLNRLSGSRSSYMYLSKLLHVFVTTSSQIDKKSKTANKRGSVFLVQYNGTWANGKWDGAGVS